MSLESIYEAVLLPLILGLQGRVPGGRVFIVCEWGAFIGELVFPHGATIPAEIHYVHSWRVPHQSLLERCLDDACENHQLFGILRRDAQFVVRFELKRPFSFDPLALLPDWLARLAPGDFRLVQTETSFTFMHAEASKDEAVRLLAERFPELTIDVSDGVVSRAEAVTST